MEEQQPTKPAAYRVDSEIIKVQTLDDDGDNKYLFRHDFARLDSTNLDLLHKREKDTKRFTERMTKGRTRSRFRSDDADVTFYRSLIRGGGWRPHGITAKDNEDLIEPSMKAYYKQDENGIWQPTWMELDVATMLKLTPEKMSEAIERWFMCRGKKLASEQGNIDFMFEQGGTMDIEFLIGDFEQPAYRPAFRMRRPDSKRRTKFKEDFAYSIEQIKGDMGKIETVIDLRQAIGFFDEYFITCVDGDQFSEVLITDKTPTNGSEPKAISAVPVEGEEEFVNLVPYSDRLRTDFLATFNPHYKVEVAAATVQAFARTDQEL